MDFVNLFWHQMVCKTNKKLHSLQFGKTKVIFFHHFFFFFFWRHNCSYRNHSQVLICCKQVCARKRKTFVLVDSGSVYGFGWMGFGSLGFLDRGLSEKILRPRILDSLRFHRVSQISTGLYHTVVVTGRGQIFGFGDNERAQLGHDTLRSCLKPTEIFINDTADDIQKL